MKTLCLSSFDLWTSVSFGQEGFVVADGYSWSELHAGCAGS